VRFFLGAAHTTEQVDHTIDIVGAALAAISPALAKSCAATPSSAGPRLPQVSGAIPRDGLTFDIFGGD
jgi:hypothetical protein